MNRSDLTHKIFIPEAKPLFGVGILKKVLGFTFFMVFLFVAYVGYFIFTVVHEFSEVQFSDEAAAKASDVLLVAEGSPYEIDKTANLPGFKVILFNHRQKAEMQTNRQKFQVYAGLDLASVSQYVQGSFNIKIWELLGNSIERITDPDDPEVLTIEGLNTVERGQFESKGLIVPYQVINFTFHIDDDLPETVPVFMAEVTSPSGKKSLIIALNKRQSLQKTDILPFLQSLIFQ